MTAPTATSSPRPPLWRDVRVLRWAFQLAVLAVVVLIVATLVNNVRVNSSRSGIPTGFDYLDRPAQFPIADSDFRQTQPIRDAVAIGVMNTLRVSLIGMVAATLLGTLVGIARLSRNWLVRSAARVYVEALRNIPLLLLIFFSYISLALATFPRVGEAWEPLGLLVMSNRGLVVPWHQGGAWPIVAVTGLAVVVAWLIARWRASVHARTGEPARSGIYAAPVAVAIVAVGWALVGPEVQLPELEGNRVRGGMRMSPEFFAIFFALVIYTASHIAEIVRGSIQAVQRGQGEAADALALSGWQRLRFVILPQAFRIAVPPLGNQYLNLTKNSTLGAAVSYFELAQVTSISVANGAPAVPSFLLTLVIFLVLSLILSAMVNLVNRRLALVER
jgi:general L-amino acid transport system permease protein